MAQRMITKPMSILAVDPGKATGVAWIEVEPGTPAEIIDAYETGGTLHETIAVFNTWNRARRFAPAPLDICEDWIAIDTEFVTQPALAIEPMAWLKMLASDAGIEIETPYPQQRLAFSDKVFHDSGYWHVGGAGHARSAIRHGLSWCLRQIHLPTMHKLVPRS